MILDYAQVRFGLLPLLSHAYFAFFAQLACDVHTYSHIPARPGYLPTFHGFSTSDSLLMAMRS